MTDHRTTETMAFTPEQNVWYVTGSTVYGYTEGRIPAVVSCISLTGKKVRIRFSNKSHWRGPIGSEIRIYVYPSKLKVRS